MSRSCHKRDVFEGGLRIGADHARQAADLLAGHRIALVRHGGGAFLSGGERFFGFAHLGALQVADFERDLFQAGGDASARRRDSERGGRARSPARRSARGFETQTGADFFLGFRADVGEGADGAGDLADAHFFRGGGKAGADCEPNSSYQRASFRPNVMGSACMPWVRPICDGVAGIRRRGASATSRKSRPDPQQITPSAC